MFYISSLKTAQEKKSPNNPVADPGGSKGSGPPPLLKLAEQKVV